MDTSYGMAGVSLAALAKNLYERHKNDPDYVARVLADILALGGEGKTSPDELAGISQYMESLRAATAHDKHRLQRDDIVFRKEITEYYIPKQLIDAIIENGGIPKDSIETLIGVGFIDVADYTYLAKFLSAKENQILLNGLYTAFSTVLKKHGGYLNKIEGDCIMFHYGGLIDPRVKDLTPRETAAYITRELFYTCVEMQWVCYQFNMADPSLPASIEEREGRETVQAAFAIISNMRNDAFMANSFNALFQIRIRIGANVGEVRIGNFGPPGRKVWDVIGIPVIDAKRMESTAPVGGLRISEGYYRLLGENGIVDSYFDEFKRAATAIDGYFKDITREELFSYTKVVLKDKKNVEFDTYSIQVNPNLPEMIQQQIKLLLHKGDIGAEKIIELVQYYRGNKYIITAVEDLFNEKGVVIRKDKILHYIQPRLFGRIVKKLGKDRRGVRSYIQKRYSLCDLFRFLGKYQDKIKDSYNTMETPDDFVEWEKYMERQLIKINANYKELIKYTIHNTYFYNVVFPLVFRSLKASILEYQNRNDADEEDIELAEEAI